MALHVIPNAGSIFLPMHIPVLLCDCCVGLIMVYYVVAGACFIQCFNWNVHLRQLLPGMICELAMYGFMTGWMSKKYI